MYRVVALCLDLQLARETCASFDPLAHDTPRALRGTAREADSVTASAPRNWSTRAHAAKENNDTVLRLAESCSLSSQAPNGESVFDSVAIFFFVLRNLLETPIGTQKDSLMHLDYSIGIQVYETNQSLLLP